MVLRSSLLRGNVLSCVSLALLVSLVPACSDDSPESDARGGSDGDETSPESDGADEEVDLALASLTVSVGPLQPAFDPTLDAFEVAFSGVPAAKLVAVPRNPEAKVAIAGVEGQERSLRAPLGSTEVEVTVSVGEKSRTVRVELARSGQYVAETPIPPPDEPAMDDSNPNSKGYGYPTVSPDGRFIAVQLSAPTANAYQRWIDIFRADGPELVFEKRLDNRTSRSPSATPIRAACGRTAGASMRHPRDGSSRSGATAPGASSDPRGSGAATSNTSPSTPTRRTSSSRTRPAATAEPSLSAPMAASARCRASPGSGGATRWGTTSSRRIARS